MSDDRAISTYNFMVFLCKYGLTDNLLTKCWQKSVYADRLENAGDQTSYQRKTGCFLQETNQDTNILFYLEQSGIWICTNRKTKKWRIDYV